MKNKADGKKEFKDALRDNTLLNLYVFYGQETYLRDYYLNELKKKIQGMEEFNLHIFDGKGLTTAEISDAVNNLPVFSDKKLIIIRDLDIYKADAQMKPFLEELFADIPEYCIIVIVYDAIEYKSDARQKIHAAVKKHGAFVEFSEQSRHDLVAWIKRRFASLEKTIDSADAEYLLFLCGGYMNNLITEIEKIGSFAKGKNITRRDIDTVATPVLDAVVFELTDAISQRSADKSLEILRELILQREEPIAILGAIGNNIRRLYAAKLAVNAKKGVSYVMELCSLKSSYPAELAIKAAGKVTVQWCREAVKLCAKTDYNLKSSAADKETEISMLVLELLQG